MGGKGELDSEQDDVVPESLEDWRDALLGCEASEQDLFVGHQSGPQLSNKMAHQSSKLHPFTPQQAAALEPAPNPTIAVTSIGLSVRRFERCNIIRPLPRAYPCLSLGSSFPPLSPGQKHQNEQHL